MAAERNVPRRVGVAKATVAVRVRDHAPPEAIEAARRDLNYANSEQHIKRMVSLWPPLTPEQKAELAVILLSGGDHAAT